MSNNANTLQITNSRVICHCLEPSHITISHHIWSYNYPKGNKGIGLLVGTFFLIFSHIAINVPSISSNSETE